MNKKQKLVLAIFVPMIVFFIALIIANSVGYTVIYKPGTFPGGSKPAKPTTYYRESNPFDWEKTWYVWVIYLIFVCIFEYKIFEDKEIISNKKKKKLK